MPFVVVITAVAIVNNGDDNAVRFVSVLPFVVFLLFCCFYPDCVCWQKKCRIREDTFFFFLHWRLHFVIVILSFEFKM